MNAITAAMDSVLVNGDATSARGTNDELNSLTDNEPYLAFDGCATCRGDEYGQPARFRQRADAGQDALGALQNAGEICGETFDLAWIVDPNTYAALLGLSEFITMDKAGAHATALTGQLGFVDGIPLLVCPDLPLTTASGGVEIGETNDKGTAICVYRPGWLVGFRRRIAVSVDYLPYYDAYQMTATVRLALGRYDDDVAAAGYNITV